MVTIENERRRRLAFFLRFGKVSPPEGPRPAPQRAALLHKVLATAPVAMSLARQGRHGTDGMETLSLALLTLPLLHTTYLNPYVAGVRRVAAQGGQAYCGYTYIRDAH